MKKVAVFVSGSGTNAENIINYFSENNSVEIVAVFANKPNIKAIERAYNLNIPAIIFTRDQFYNTNFVNNQLMNLGVDLIVLAGFLWLIPAGLINDFQERIINIHPALLPKYGGKGMYGDRVHNEVVKNKEKVSGITIHRVNEKYDDGAIIFQSECIVEPTDGPEEVARKVHELEYKHFPKVIEEYLMTI